MVKCTNSRSIRTTNSAKQTKCHLNLEASDDDDEEGIEDPFAAYEAAQAAAQHPLGPESSPVHDGSDDDDDEVEDAVAAAEAEGESEGDEEDNEDEDDDE